MLFGDREKLLDVLKNNPNILKSISKEFQNDPEFLKAFEVINSKLESGSAGLESFTSDASEMIDYTASEYESIIKFVNDMKKIHFDIVNSISLISDVDLNESDYKKISNRVNEDIKSLEKIKLKTDDLISEIFSSIVIGARVSLERRNLSVKDDSLKESIDVFIEDRQYILGRDLNGDYYISVNKHMSDDINLVKDEVISIKPELSDINFKIDNGEIISSDGYEIIFNGYVSKKKRANDFVVENSNGESSSVKDNLSGRTNDVQVFGSDDNDLSNLKVDDSQLLDTKLDDSNLKVDDAITPSVFESTPLEIGNIEGNLEGNFEDFDGVSSRGIGVKVSKSPDISAVKNVDNQFVFGKKDNIYYLVISPQINSFDIRDIKYQIASFMPELAGSRFIIDYGGILCDSSFEILLTGFVKKSSQGGLDVMSESRGR